MNGVTQDLQTLYSLPSHPTEPDVLSFLWESIHPSTRYEREIKAFIRKNTPLSLGNIQWIFKNSRIHQLKSDLGEAKFKELMQEEGALFLECNEEEKRQQNANLPDTKENPNPVYAAFEPNIDLFINNGATFTENTPLIKGWIDDSRKLVDYFSGGYEGWHWARTYTPEASYTNTHMLALYGKGLKRPHSKKLIKLFEKETDTTIIALAFQNLGIKKESLIKNIKLGYSTDLSQSDLFDDETKIKIYERSDLDDYSLKRESRDFKIKLYHALEDGKQRDVVRKSLGVERNTTHKMKIKNNKRK